MIATRSQKRTPEARWRAFFRPLPAGATFPVPRRDVDDDDDDARRGIDVVHGEKIKLLRKQEAKKEIFLFLFSECE